MTLAVALRLFRADMVRRSRLREEKMTVWNMLKALSRPGVLGVLLLRIGNWLHARRRRIASRLVERLIFFVTRSELQPGCRIGPGLVLADEGTVGITSRARIGANCTLFGLASIIPQEGGVTDTVIGDNCVFGRRVRVYGAITLGDGTQVKENSVVLTSFKRPGMIVSGIPARRRGQVPLELVKSWNPLKGRPLHSDDGSDAP
jgi:serine O-acetyltransferase